VSEEYSLRYPRLYTPGHLDLFFNKKVFAQSVAEGIITSLVLFFIPYGAFVDSIQPDGTENSGHKEFGVAVASILIVAVTLRVSRLEIQYQAFE
jgi:phospholipid-translocating ATPase